ncbi:ABC transporter permease [Paradesulfitobacterium ferrireducens]|uniref:ABC transporter permease n=1 Tax=Paradesulfitobacterium ferrireducens TaxID=2816476 RepID=UPI001AD8FE72|nr:ABC transporter permease [Paradesulfitobacterium ferrireducens]
MKFKNIVIPVVAIAVALIFGAIIIAVMGLDPLLAYESLVQGAFGSVYGVTTTLAKATPLIFTGLSFALAKKTGLLNIGAEGQLYMGGLCSVLVAAYLPPMPMILHLSLEILAGFTGGGLWGLLAGWLKVRFGSSEIITTVMLNYTAMFFIAYMVNGPIIEPPGNLPQSKPIPPSAIFPSLIPNTQLHLGFAIAILMAVFYYIFLWHTRKGYEARVVGLNPEAATYAGMNKNRLVFLIMFLAGGLGGLAGSSEILGIQHRLFQAFSPGYGYDGIAVALLGLNSPIGTVLAAILFGALRSGGDMMQMVAHVPLAIIYVIQALVIMFVAAEYLFRRFGGFKQRAAKLLKGAGKHESV